MSKRFGCFGVAIQAARAIPNFPFSTLHMLTPALAPQNHMTVLLHAHITTYLTCMCDSACLLLGATCESAVVCALTHPSGPYQALLLGIKIAQEPYIVWSLVPKALIYESLDS